MISKFEFVLIMNELKSLDDKINNVDRAMKELDPDFCGFYIPDIFSTTFKLLKIVINDKDDWIEYFVYEKDWLKDFEIGDITVHGKPINIVDWGDVYDFLVR